MDLNSSFSCMLCLLMISSNLVLVIGEQGGHLVKRPPPHRLVIPRRGQVVSDTLLVVPHQPVQGQHIGVADEGHGVGLGVVNGLAVTGRCPRSRGCSGCSGGMQSTWYRQWHMDRSWAGNLSAEDTMALKTICVICGRFCWLSSSTSPVSILAGSTS